MSAAAQRLPASLGGLDGLLEGLLARVREEAREGAKEGTAAALAAVQGDTWLDASAAARIVYGRDDRLEAFAQLRRRRPELDACSVGSGKLRRWRRSDLDRLLAEGLLGRRAPGARR